MGFVLFFWGEIRQFPAFLKPRLNPDQVAHENAKVFPTQARNAVKGLSGDVSFKVDLQRFSQCIP